MGENKGHGNKAPNYPELDEGNSAGSRAGQDAGNQQSAGRQRDAGKQQDISQQGSQQGSGQSIGSQSGRKQDGDKLQNTGSQQKGGQHASGGTPALDDLNAGLNSRDQGPLGNAPEQMDQQSGWDGKQDKKR